MHVNPCLRAVGLLLCATGLLGAAPVAAQIYPPMPGVELPQAFYDRIASDPQAFTFKHAWIHKAQRAKRARQDYFGERGLQPVESLPEWVRRQIVVGGTVRVPVFAATYANTTSPPYPVADLQRELFDGPWLNGTVTDFYDEVSYGNVEVTGTVYDWVQVSQNDTYYEGGCNGLCELFAKTGQFIREVIQLNDFYVDFGQYDNDGPDNVPNSGDDDGFVDFVSFVQPEQGGECGNSNIWSHRWWVSGWPEFFGQPYTTTDASANGGFIKIEDYTIQPAKACGSGGLVKIAVFCHEFGHAFGLPDLYDTDRGGFGIGEHGLMGTQNPQSLDNPAHMSAWSKRELGWLSAVAVGPVEQAYVINNSELNPIAYRLDVVEDKFGRSDLNPLDGGHSLRCGLSAAQAAVRNWQGGAGSGDAWNESIHHDFTFDGSGPVALQYDVSYDVEPNYDYAYIKIVVNGTESTLATYNGSGSLSGHTIDLTPYLSGSGATSYQVVAQFISDVKGSDADGVYDSGPGGPFILDNVSVVGGGENYAANFEQYEDGWYTQPGPDGHKEYFLVENRNKVSFFDQGIPGQGLQIWHIDETIMDTRQAGNTGGTAGTTNLRPAGVLLVEADGNWNLIKGQNRGDASDLFPGPVNNREFNDSTSPNSRSHNQAPTRVAVENIGNPGVQMTATMRGGHFAPAVTSMAPATGEQDRVVPVTALLGSGFVHGATLLLRDAGQTESAAASVSWIGKAALAGSLDLGGLSTGSYDVVVRNPDGQEAVLAGGFEVTEKVPTLIQAFRGRPRGKGVELAWEVWSDEVIRGFQIRRRVDGGGAAIDVLDGGLIPAESRTFHDEGVDAGRSYGYVLLVVLGDGGTLLSQWVTVALPTEPLALYQNHPNPFNPSTRIRFSLPELAGVKLTIYDPAGRRVRRLIDGARPAGQNTVEWDGRNDAGNEVSSGVYLYRLVYGQQVETKKLTLVR